ncbi:hypothetical protein ACKEPO_15945 [Acinetobacter baumannii]|uniref:hypothetical protein n=1 Tax=Acinetobacter calcoaceticus/baumannii complex TaxID=909768 RepID=UPI0029574864|nr:hypothetical protein [Acinetobacter baumannii]MDX7938814.1 hypothetical protein [Acinetobacter baumannii]MDX7942292.1 hypothetical protein [Acinetobacter baumannii]
MSFPFFFKREKQEDHFGDTSKVIADAAESYKKAIQESIAQYNEHRKKAEEQINRGARITKHRINL